MSCPIDSSTWITTIASAVSAVASWQMWQVSKNTLKLQESIESVNSPKVYIWFNGQIAPPPKIIYSLSFVNIGKTALPIRTLRILAQNGQATRCLFSDQTQDLSGKAILAKMQLHFNSGNQSKDTDIILSPNLVYQAFFEIESSQFKIEVMFYDNSFEFIEIDTSNLGGKYILTGKGKKP